MEVTPRSASILQSSPAWARSLFGRLRFHSQTAHSAPYPKIGILLLLVSLPRQTKGTQTRIKPEGHAPSRGPRARQAPWPGRGVGRAGSRDPGPASTRLAATQPPRSGPKDRQAQRPRAWGSRPTRSTLASPARAAPRPLRLSPPGLSRLPYQPGPPHGHPSISSGRSQLARSAPRALPVSSRLTSRVLSQRANDQGAAASALRLPPPPRLEAGPAATPPLPEMVPRRRRASPSPGVRGPVSAGYARVPTRRGANRTPCSGPRGARAAWWRDESSLAVPGRSQAVSLMATHSSFRLPFYKAKLQDTSWSL